MTASGGTTTGTNTTYTATVTITARRLHQCRAHGAVAHYRLACFRNAFGRDLLDFGRTELRSGRPKQRGERHSHFVVQQISAGTATMNVEVSGSENDPTTSNNAANASVTVTGSAFNLPPALSAISPSAIEAGASDTVITVTGAGFTSASSVLLGSTTLTTTYTSPTTMTATVPAAQLASLGWAAITVSNRLLVAALRPRCRSRYSA